MLAWRDDDAVECARIALDGVRTALTTAQALPGAYWC
jgi:hypothetical protein